MKLKKSLIILCILLFPIVAQAFEVLGYIYRSNSISHLTSGILSRQNRSMKKNIRYLNIIAPQAYQVDAKGTVWGELDPLVMRMAKRHHVRILPLLTNQDFDSKITHKFLENQTAQTKAIRSMVEICEKQSIAGFQIDFEHILLSDKNAFSKFYQKAASALHAHHFMISVAIIPRITDITPATAHDRSALEYWNGAYDYTVLGKASDFVTLMTYDQHGGGTTPGSSCEPGWLKKVIVYALKYIPANKISIGLPIHSSYWYTAVGKDLYVGESDLTYQQADYLIKEHHAQIIWDKKTTVPYVIFTEDNLNRFVFLQNAQTFQLAMHLIKHYQLRGVSLWCLGYEDPQIWKIIAVEKT